MAHQTFVISLYSGEALRIVHANHNMSFDLIIDLLHGLGKMGLELVVSVSGLVDALLQCRVRIVPRRPHVVGALRHQVVDVRTEPL